MGVDVGIYTPKISPSKLLWCKNDVRMAIQQFYTPQKILYPQNKFLAMPLVCGGRGRGTYTAGTVNFIPLLEVERKTVYFPSHF